MKAASLLDILRTRTQTRAPRKAQVNPSLYQLRTPPLPNKIPEKAEGEAPIFPSKISGKVSTKAREKLPKGRGALSRLKWRSPPPSQKLPPKKADSRGLFGKDQKTANLRHESDGGGQVQVPWQYIRARRFPKRLNRLQKFSR